MSIDLAPILITVFLVAVVLVVFLIYICTNSPFVFPYKRIRFDVTGTRLPNINDYIDEYLIRYGMEPIDDHIEYVEKWKQECICKIDKSTFKKRREKQFLKCIDESRMYHFTFTREKTKYRQVNYVKYSYKETVVVESFYCSYDFLADRYQQLKSIKFEATLSMFHSKEQRKLMTKELREKIAYRDNYTCQICGKTMFDGVGLQIDHIIPVSKGGKSVPSNLRVLCSKCNGKKSNRIQ